MKKVLICIAILASFNCYSQSLSLKADSKVIVCFTPGDKCSDIIVNQLDKAKKVIQVQAYSFTSVPIAEAIVRARKRGIKVEVILDKGQKTARYSSFSFLLANKVSTYIDTKHAIAHNKVIIIDGEVLITGSFNFTKAAQNSNAENLIVLHDLDLVNLYQKNWQLHKNHSIEQ